MTEFYDSEFYMNMFDDNTTTSIKWSKLMKFKKVHIMATKINNGAYDIRLTLTYV